MKKIFPLVAASMLAVSCFNDVGYEASYTLAATFEGMDEVFEADSAVAIPSFSYGPVAFYNTVAASETVSAPDGSEGGWIISRSFYPIDILLGHIGTGDGSGNAGDDGGDSGDGTGTYTVDWQSKLTPYCVSDTTDASSRSGGTFLVFHDNSSSMPEHDMEFLQASVGTCTVSGCYLNTTAQVANHFKSDLDADSSDDYFIVKVTGSSDAGQTGSAEFVLADYRNGLDSLATDWFAADLSKLGSVRYVDFEIETSLSNPELRYFCMDNFVASIYVKQ